MNALATLIVVALLALAPVGQTAAQTRAGAPAVTVTLVRWPYT